MFLHVNDLFGTPLYTVRLRGVGPTQVRVSLRYTSNKEG